jgi:hypothetical protein
MFGSAFALVAAAWRATTKEQINRIATSGKAA